MYLCRIGLQRMFSTPSPKNIHELADEGQAKPAGSTM
jgi:hypothetical protein